MRYDTLTWSHQHRFHTIQHMLDLNKKTSFDAHSVDEFNAHVRACTACALSQGRTQVVVGDGPLPCEIMIVGEAPGEQEDEQGRPFVGRSGKLLTDLLEQQCS